MNETRRLVILGSTGSIGRQALEVAALHPDKYEIVALAARDEYQLLLQQVREFRPRYALLTDQKAYRLMKDALPRGVEALWGYEAMEELAALPQADIVLVALSGAVGIKPTLAAVKQKSRVALANKETLVAAGEIVMKAVRDNGVELIPVDSEHSAIYQCLKGEERWVENIWLTASGGPFYESSHQMLENVTPDMALCHPNWAMGPKITIDSATMMNKGLEVIEAHHLFAVSYDKIRVVIQRESVVHSMVEFVDGSFLAHLGAADMRIPIQYAFSYPEREVSPARHLDFTLLGSLRFGAPDNSRFPALNLAYEAGKAGGTMPAVFNAANEVAVGLFIEGLLPFTSISRLVRMVMEDHLILAASELETILAADSWARDQAKRMARHAAE